MLTPQERLILLNLTADVGSTRLRRLLDAFGTLERVFCATSQELQQVEGIGPVLAERIVSGCRDERLLAKEFALAKQHGATILTLEDAAYPKPLRAIHDPPLALYVRGRLEASDDIAVGIVGARHASRYGLETAEHLAYDLALRGITVVSGLARGIDGAAHRGALKASGRTIADLGNGLSRIYPPEHQALAKQVVESGALLSEYPMEAQPLAHHFPQRNRLISGLSLGIIVVEAAQRSGALITADCALEQGREVFAVPGPMTAVTSQGTHQLLKQGARLVTSVEDILEELRLTPQSAHPNTLERVTPEPRPLPPGADDADSAARRGRRGGAGGRTRLESVGIATLLSDLEERVFGCVDQQEPSDIDGIASRSGLEVSLVSSALLQLELKHLVQQLPGNRYIRYIEVG